MVVYFCFAFCLIYHFCTLISLLPPFFNSVPRITKSVCKDAVLYYSIPPESLPWFCDSGRCNRLQPGSGLQRNFATRREMQTLPPQFCHLRINLTLMAQLAAGVNAVCTTAIKTSWGQKGGVNSAVSLSEALLFDRRNGTSISGVGPISSFGLSLQSGRMMEFGRCHCPTR